MASSVSGLADAGSAAAGAASGASSALAGALAPVAGPLAIGASLVQAFGQLSQGAADAASHQANARMALKQTEVARQASYLKSAEIERQGAQVEGMQQAGQGHAGVSPNLWLLSDTAHRVAMSKMSELYQGRQEAAQQLREADIQHAQATAARTGSYIGAAGSVLGGIASAALA